MLDKVKKISKNTMVYGFGNALNKLLGFILIPVYTGFISIDSFGILTILEITILALVSLLNFGIVSGHQRHFYKEKDNKEYGVFLFNNYLGNIFLTLLSVFALFIFSQNFTSLLFGNIDYQFLVKLTLIIIIFEILILIPIQILQFEEKSLQYIILNALKLIISLSLTIYFVVYKHLDIEGILYARLIGSGTVFIIGIIWIIIPRITIKLDFKKLWKSISFGFPLIMSSIGVLIFSLSDRYMINWLSTSAETGKYGFGYRIANFINLVFIQSIGISYLPNMFKQEKEKDNKRFYKKMLTYYVLALSLIILSFLFFYKIILHPLVLNNEYWKGLQIVPILTLNFLIHGMNYFVNVGIMLKNKTIYYLIPSLSAAIINIILNIFLIPIWGFWGAAFSTLIAQIINTGIISYYSQKFYKFSFEWGKIFIVLILAIIFYYIGTQINFNIIILKVAVRIILIILFPFIIYKLNFFEAIEIQSIKGGLKKWLILKNLRKNISKEISKD